MVAVCPWWGLAWPACLKSAGCGCCWSSQWVIITGDVALSMAGTRCGVMVVLSVANGFATLIGHGGGGPGSGRGGDGRLVTE